MILTCSDTKIDMKKAICLIFLCCANIMITLSAQTACQAQLNIISKNEFAEGARRASKEIALLLPAGAEQARENTADQFKIILSDARVLAARVQKMENKMTDAQYKTFQRELRIIESQLDQLQAGNAGASGPAQSECFSSCDRQYCGWDGSNGWNRFWCKANCFRISVYVNS